MTVASPRTTHLPGRPSAGRSAAVAITGPGPAARDASDPARQEPAAQALLSGWALAQRRRNLSPGTIYGRGRHVLHFARWLEYRDRSLGTATREDVSTYLDQRHIAAKTRYAYTSSLATFYGWAIREGFLTANPAADVDRPKLPHYLPRPILTDELAVAIELAPMPVRGFLVCAAYAGLRCQEIAGLQWRDVLDNQEPPLLIVSHGKGQRQRVVPLHAEVATCLRLASDRRDGYVFRRAMGARHHPHDVSHAVNDYLHELGITSTAHSLRHWFATTVYRSTRDLRLTQSLLGHSSPTTTAIYTALDPGDGVAVVMSLSVDPS